MKVTLPCIVCGKQLQPVFADQDVNQPNDGLAFSTKGHYGSTVFDPGLGTMSLEVNICDPCLTEAGDKQQVILHKLHNQEFVQQQWQAPQEGEDNEW